MSRNNDGFTLVEVLVAFAVMAGAILLALETWSAGLRQLREAELVLQAQGLARSVLANNMNSVAAEVSQQSGTVDGLSWQTTRKPLYESQSARLSPVVVEITIAGPDGKPIPAASLSTVILVKAAQ